MVASERCATPPLANQRRWGMPKLINNLLRVWWRRRQSHIFISQYPIKTINKKTPIDAPTMNWPIFFWFNLISAPMQCTPSGESLQRSGTAQDAGVPEAPLLVSLIAHQVVPGFPHAVCGYLGGLA